jgi:hypothetical protein
MSWRNCSSESTVFIESPSVIVSVNPPARPAPPALSPGFHPAWLHRKIHGDEYRQAEHSQYYEERLLRVKPEILAG